LITLSKCRAFEFHSPGAPPRPWRLNAPIIYQMSKTIVMV